MEYLDQLFCGIEPSREGHGPGTLALGASQRAIMVMVIAECCAWLSCLVSRASGKLKVECVTGSSCQHARHGLLCKWALVRFVSPLVVDFDASTQVSLATRWRVCCTHLQKNAPFSTADEHFFCHEVMSALVGLECFTRSAATLM